MRIVLRLALLALAGVHLFPATKHLRAFFERPCLEEGWEGFGAVLAITLYLLPLGVHARMFASLWRERRWALRIAGVVLAAAHAVPAFDHLPRFLDAPSWADGWRGIGAALAVLWFLAPLRAQARAVSRVRGGSVERAMRFWAADGMKRTVQLTAFAGVAILVGAFFGARLVAKSSARTRAPRASSRRAPAAPAPLELRVPRAKGPIAIDGELDEPAWRRAIARTNAFVDADGRPAHPYSDARVAWGDGVLYVTLYAADENVVSAPSSGPDGAHDDVFQLELTTEGTRRALQVSALGDVRDLTGGTGEAWTARVRTGTDVDGTLNDPSDDDEEWIIEMAIPLDVLGARGAPEERIGFSVRRCDTPKGRAEACASWPGEAPGVLVLGD